MRRLMDVVVLWCLFCGLVFGQASNPQNTFANAVNAAGPSVWLNFNDPTTAFKDQVSRTSFVNTGTTTTTTTHSPAPPAAASNGQTYFGAFNGTNDYLTVTTSTLNPAAYTFSAWVYLTAIPTSGNYVTIMAQGAGGFTTILVQSSGTILAGITTTAVNTNTNISYAGSHVLAVNTWYFISMTYDSVAGLTGYVNGAVDGSAAANGTAADNTGPFEIGGNYPCCGGRYLNGQISDVSIYNVALTSAQINTLYTGGSITSGLIGQWDIDEGAGTTAIDSSTGGNNLTWAGTTSGNFGYYWGPGTTSVVNTYTSGAVTPAQPGFDNTNAQQLSAEFPYNGFNAAPNNTLGDIEWDVPWTMLIHVDRLNWDGNAKLVLASKGDVASSTGSWWELSLQQNTTNANASQLCFERNGTGENQAQQLSCTGTGYDAMPNGFNYDIVVEDSGTGQASAVSMWMNGLPVGTSIPSYVSSNTSAQGFGNVTWTVTAGGTGYAASTAFTSTGGGANCVVTGTAIATSGVITSAVSNAGDSNAGCTSAPTIVLTAPTGTGANITANVLPMSMNSTTEPLMVPGYVSSGVSYGVGGSDTTQNPVYIDEFAIFPGNLTFGQISNIFYETKFYQGQLFPGITTNPPLVIFESTGCGPDFSGDQTTAMLLGSVKAGLIRLLGLDIDDGNPNGTNSVGWWRQMLDQAGLADVPVSWGGSASIVGNTGGCPAANITAYNASTPQNPASYEAAATMYRTLFAKYPTTPIYVLLTQVYNGYAQFLASPADSISPLTGLQMQAQNAANGGWVNIYEGNTNLDTTDLDTVWTSNGAMPIWVPGGNGGKGGPGILVSKTANDPLYMTAAKMAAGDSIYGYTNQNFAMVLSPYFYGGVTISYSGGTGYANATPFTSIGGGPHCHVTGMMTASGGVPNGIDYSWGGPIPSTTTYDGLGYGCVPATFTATGSGTSLTVSSVFGVITVGDTISGTGIPAGTTITAQTSGTTGGAGVYTTSVATTASAAAVTRTPTIVLTNPTGTGVTLTPALGVFLSNYGAGATNTWKVWPNQYDQNPTGGTSPTTAPIFSWFTNSLMDPPTNGAPRVP